MTRPERERLKIMAGRRGGVVDAGGGGRIDGGALSAEQAHLASVFGRWGRRFDASAARRKPSDLREQVLAQGAEERFEGFGPTLMAEQLLIFAGFL